MRYCPIFVVAMPFWLTIPALTLHAEEVLAVLERNCGACHAASAMSGLDIRSRNGLLKGGTRGAAIQPGDRNASLLFRSMTGAAEPKMPPGKALLTAEEIETVGKWIDSGAAWPEAKTPEAETPVAKTHDESAAIALLRQNCFSCHAEAKTSGLDMRTRAGLLTGGSRGPAIVPSDKAKSKLYEAVLRTGELKMPPGKHALSAGDIETLGAWIDGGAKWDDSKPQIAAEHSWWSFRKLKRPEVPLVKAGSPIANPIDSFVLSSLEKKGWKPAEPASKQTLVRRAFFDLWGLPPTPEQVNEFVTDTSPAAWEKLIDRLLASPRYGERWGRYWLDVARYADTGGFEHDMVFPNAWRYRDYVIRSFNEDKPYAQFVQEQIAADEIWPDNLDLTGTYELPAEKKKHMEARIGTGLYTVGAWYPATAILPEYLRSERLSDAVDTTGAAFLGLTFGCARCHDHKFDPLPQRDYYRLSAVFAASEEREIPIVELTKIVDFQKHMTRVWMMDDLKQAVESQMKQVRTRLAAAPADEEGDTIAAQPAPAAKSQKTVKLNDAEVIARMTPPEKAHRDDLLRRIGEAYLPFPGHYPTASVLAPVERIPDTHVLKRGDYQSPGEKVNPGLPIAVSDGRDIPSEGRRKQFALWLTEPDHPLTWRVMVNRIWQGHFGFGLVRTPNDFGRQGEAPTHPELLDWLASEFVSEKTSMKALHRLIMLSNAYRMSVVATPEYAAADPENKLLWRQNRKRLDAEAVRDAVLTVSGKLDTEMYGPPVATPLSREEMGGIKETYMWPATVNPAKASRRSVYLYIKRSFRYPLFEIFDAPDPIVSCARRETTTVPPQALALLNNKFVVEQAGHLAKRMTRDTSNDAPAKAIRGWELALARKPSDAELKRAVAMLDGTGEDGLHRYCLTLFNLSEFLYVD